MFDIVGGKVVLDADSLAIPPFKKFLENSKNEAKALKEIEYMVWLYKWNTPYLAYDPDVRASIVSKDIFGVELYHESEELKSIIKRFDEFQNTVLIRFYKSAEAGVEYVNAQLAKAEENQMDPEKVVKLVERADKITTSLENLKARAVAEQSNSGRIKGGGKAGYYELPRKKV